ncbi:MAG: hypothetical protein ACLT09_14885 [Flavonifractor plautii]
MVTVRDGAITGLNDGGQVDVSEETAAEAVKQAQSSGASQGVLRELRLRFLVERRPDGELRIAFADLGWETASCAICPCCPCWCGLWPWWVSFS